MSRQLRLLRIQYEGAIYHLMSRGDRREEIFCDDVDRKKVFGSGLSGMSKDWVASARLPVRGVSLGRGSSSEQRRRLRSFK